MNVDSYELIFLKGEPKALTLAHDRCVGFGRFVALEQTSTALLLSDASGKTLSLALPKSPLAAGQELSVFALFDNGQTASQSSVFVE